MRHVVTDWVVGVPRPLFDRRVYSERERERDCVVLETGIIYMRTRHQEMHAYA
jgi:hypothetical protein